MATLAGLKRGPTGVQATKPGVQQTASNTRKYIYAIVGGGSGDRVYDFGGLEQSPVYVISNGRVGSAVSDVAEQRIRPERRHLAAHRAVLDQLIAREPAVLPMRFGTIAKGSEAIRAMLGRERERFGRQLQRVSGKVEMGLRVRWDVPNIFDYFVNNHPELRAARDRLFRSYSQPLPQERIELGQMFEQFLNEDRALHSAKVEGVLSHYCTEIRHTPTRNEFEVMNLACLIERTRQDDFEAAVLEAARFFDNNFAFDYNGPWAPHAFVEMAITP